MTRSMVCCCCLLVGQMALGAVFQDGQGLFNRRLGMFIHWGIYSVNGFHEQERMRKRVPRVEYEKAASGFTAERFDPDDFVRVAESAGAEYIVFTAKHHDGFCMWDTKTTDFKVTNTPAGRDVLKELADACRRRGMKLGLYYSNPDWHHPNAYNPKSTHQVDPERGDEPDLARYREYVKAQIRELLTGYGEIVCLFWDIPTKVAAPEMNELVRGLQPGILVNNRGWSDDWDYSTPEREQLEKAEFTRFTEACDSVGAQSWGYRIDEDYHTIGYLTRAIDGTLAKGGNYLLNVGPGPDGQIGRRAKETMRRVGEWYLKVRESFRGVRANPEIAAKNGCLVTDNGRAFYLHFNKGLDACGFGIPPYAAAPERVILLNTGSELKWKIEYQPKNFWYQDADHLECLHVLDVPADDLANECIVIKVVRKDGGTQVKGVEHRHEL